MSNRRNFIKLAGLGGLGFGLSGCGAGGKETTVYDLDEIRQAALKPHIRIFNMCGYAAPKMETVRIAYIGTGNRGTSAIKRIPHIASVDVKAVCDVQKKPKTPKGT